MYYDPKINDWQHLATHRAVDVLEKAGRVQLHRYAGASSGAMMSMELLVLGQATSTSFL